MASVAVIDIGSNSIKILVARRSPDGLPVSLHTATVDARIGAGLGQKQPRLSAEGMGRGLAAIAELLAGAAPYAPAEFILVATSAVRDAANGSEFREQVEAATGLRLRILTGAEEAGLIGRGLACDPALSSLRNFYVFDLGGGSLECLAFRDRRIGWMASLPLGCVRLTEMFVADPAGPFTDQAAARIASHTRTQFAASAFRFEVPNAKAVFAGGSMTTARAIFAARHDKAVERAPAIMTLVELRALLADLAPLTLEERRRVQGLPPSRADVFPAALATIIAVAEISGISTFHHSFHNLRWGLADEALAPPP
jgi:exopolyphosphatase/guanosine-5'-triphosphate,3'-diphosphate pyrophosphatase